MMNYQKNFKLNLGMSLLKNHVNYDYCSRKKIAPVSQFIHSFSMQISDYLTI